MIMDGIFSKSMNEEPTIEDLLRVILIRDLMTQFKNKTI